MNQAKKRRYSFRRTEVDTEKICTGIEAALKFNGIDKENARLLFLGVAYNADKGALEVMDSFSQGNTDTAYYDPYMSRITTANGISYNCVELSDEEIKKADCVVFTANHSCFNVREIVKKANYVIDFRGATKFINTEEKITRV